MKKNSTTVTLFTEAEHKQRQRFITHVNDLRKPIEKYIYVSEAHPFAACSEAKHAKYNNLWLQTYKENQ